jgi:hypothetical protein
MVGVSSWVWWLSLAGGLVVAVSCVVSLVSEWWASGRVLLRAVPVLLLSFALVVALLLTVELDVFHW